MSTATIMIIPAAWHVPEHYASLETHLRSQNLEVFTERLPSMSIRVSRSSQSPSKDAAYIRDKLRPSVNAGKDVILLMHSYGGLPGALAAKGFTKSERVANGREGGVIGLIFMCAYIGGDRESTLLSKLPGGRYQPWQFHNQRSAALIPINPKHFFYNLVEDSVAETAVSLLVPFAEPAASTPLDGQSAWADAAFNGKRTYIKTTRDNAFPLEAQNAMVRDSGVEWDVVELDAGHSPHLSHTGEVARIVGERVKVFTG
ncbi:alpha/beta-hydrolase [Periconia macrospinosa]|uniref:Alpha/beta-hydrolase n=1 Tax=Periconia macrospinosa TaxID=97972 RepID=A0A2V1DQ25_9PLEO|nr:alpha/beta-hydrolase [Periconia macrospinosa]